MKIKFACAAAAVALASVSSAAYADAPTPEFTVTGSAAVVSQYRFRGVTQSDNKPAVQASITISQKDGFYVSTWGSSGASSVNADTTSASYNPAATSYVSPNNGTEIDVYGGYTHALGKTGITFDGGLYGYLYPNIPANNLFEIYGSLSKSYGPLTGKVGVNWAPAQDYFTTYGTASHYSVYEYAELSYTPAKLSALTVHGHLGHTGGGLDYGRNYIDYTVGVGYKWKSLTFDISAVGTDISKGTIASLGGGAVGSIPNYSLYRPIKTVPVFSLTASF